MEKDSGDSLVEEEDKKHPQKPPPKQNSQSHPPSKKIKSPAPPQRPAQITPPPQQPRNTPSHLTEFLLSLTPPSISPISTPKLLSRPHSVARDSILPAQSPITIKHRARSASNEVRRAFNGFYFCQDILEQANVDHLFKKTLKPLTSLKTIDNHKDVTNPYLFKGALMVTTFVHSAGNRTKELWRLIEEASRVDIRLAEMKHPSLNVMSTKCTGRVPIYVHPSFYRSLKLRYFMDVGGISRDGRVTNELGSGSLRKAVGILTPEDFRPVVNSESSK